MNGLYSKISGNKEKKEGEQAKAVNRKDIDHINCLFINGIIVYIQI